MDNNHAVREMRRARLEVSINVTTGELLDLERVTSSSERGGWKRAVHFSTSLAAYSTSCTVLRRRGDITAALLPGGADLNPSNLIS
jgi:hypothetical protein